MFLLSLLRRGARRLPPMHHRIVAPVLFMAFSAAPLCATVVVHQVEASESDTVQRYAPIDFAGSATQAGTANFSGITFHALDSTTDTFSFHANAVGNGIYGAGTAGHPFVANVYNDDVDHFFTAVVKAQASVGIAPVPGMFGNGTKVSNHSYAGTFASGENPPLDIDKDAMHRLDFMANREDVLVAVAAVADPTPGTSFYHNNLSWGARNVVAVRGDQVFDPAGGTLGRQHADLWYPAPASYGTAAVSGFATGLIGTAQSLGYTGATHNVTVK